MQRNESPEDLITAAEAALVLSKNNKRTIPAAYVNQLVRYGKLKPYKLDARTNLYRRGDVEGIRIEKRGGKREQDHSKRSKQEHAA